MRFKLSVPLRLAPAGALVALGVLCACGPSALSLHAQQPETCSAEYRFTATLSGNVLGVTLAKDTPGDGEDEIPAVLTYKQSAAGASFELTPDPTGAGDIEDAPPAMLAQVEGERACLAAMGSADSASDACLQSWLSVERCYVLEPE
jgi:hypothetical protein